MNKKLIKSDVWFHKQLFIYILVIITNHGISLSSKLVCTLAAPVKMSDGLKCVGFQHHQQ